MTLLHLNLIDPDKRKRFKKLIRFLFLKELLEFILLTAAMLAIIHLLGLWVVTQTLSDLASSSLIVNREQTATNREVRRINKLTHDIIASGEDYTKITPRLIELIGLVPTNITIQLVSVDRTTNSFLLAGVADTRQALLDFQKVTQQITWIENVSTPTSQLFQKNNISFEIRANLKGFPSLVKTTPTPKPRTTNND